MENLARPRRRPILDRSADRREAYVAALVAAAPPLTPEQAERLRRLLAARE